MKFTLKESEIIDGLMADIMYKQTALDDKIEELQGFINKFHKKKYFNN